MSMTLSSQTEERDADVSLHAGLPTEVSPGGLTIFERFLLELDQPTTPMVFRVLMRFYGRLDSELLSRAYHLAALRQPMFRVQLDRPNSRWQTATSSPQLLWPVTTMTEEQIGRESIQCIDLDADIGLRTRAYRLSDGVLIHLEFHHACCDGQGARQFIAEWFSIYDQLSVNGEFSLSDLDAEKLLSRHQYRKPASPVGFWEGMRNLFVTLAGRTARVPLNSSHSDDRMVLECPLEIQQTTRLRAALKHQGFTLNDLGLACAFATYFQMFPDVCRRQKITVLNPVDLRYPSDLKVPACNRVGMAFLRRKLTKAESFPRLLASLRDQMQYVKRKYVGAEFLHGLAAVGNSKLLWRWMHQNEWFTPSLQFTCLGDTTRAIRYKFREVDGLIEVGELKLDRISGFAPVGPGIPISISACETNHRIAMTFQTHSRYLDQSQLQAFADIYMNLLTDSL